jgi:hypothetical protein
MMRADIGAPIERNRLLRGLDLPQREDALSIRHKHYRISGRSPTTRHPKQSQKNVRELARSRTLSPTWSNPYVPALAPLVTSQIVSSLRILSSSHAIPLPIRWEVTTLPSTICNGSCNSASAQSTYSSQCAVGVAESNWALTSGIR